MGDIDMYNYWIQLLDIPTDSAALFPGWNPYVSNKTHRVLGYTSTPQERTNNQLQLQLPTTVANGSSHPTPIRIPLSFPPPYPFWGLPKNLVKSQYPNFVQNQFQRGEKIPYWQDYRTEYIGGMKPLKCLWCPELVPNFSECEFCEKCQQKLQDNVEQMKREVIKRPVMNHKEKNLSWRQTIAPIPYLSLRSSKSNVHVHRDSWEQVRSLWLV